MRLKLVYVCVLLASLMLQSCLMIYSPGRSAKLDILCDPGATVTIDGAKKYAVPGRIKLKKKRPHDFLFTAEGYLNENFKLTPTYNSDLHWDAIKSWIFTAGILALADNLAGSPYRAPFKSIEVSLIRKPPQAKTNIPIRFKETAVTIDPGKKVGNFYTFRRGDMKRKDFIRSLNWGDDAKLEAKLFSRLGIEELPSYGYNIVSESNNAFSQEKNARLVISSSISDMNINIYRGRGNVCYQVDFQVNWMIQNSVGKELLRLDTRAFASKYNLNDTIVFSDAYRKALFDLFSSIEFNNLLISYEKQLLEKKDTLVLKEVKERSFSSAESLIKDVSASVVTVVTDKGHGSGFFISEEGLIMTNYHVVSSGENLRIEFGSGFTLAAHVVRVAEDQDLALIKVEGTGFKPLRINSGEEIDLGNEVYAIGTPADRSLGQSVTKGIISGKRKFNEQVYIQSDVKVNGGNSGGPLIDKNGNVLGIVNAKISGAGLEGLGFAIPAYYIFKSLNVSFK